jgi:DMSO/TMAO reductase YedYZ heme-binding membrane subunit
MVALILLTLTVVIGVVASVGWTTERWPRFLSQSVHRNLSLFCVGFVALHVITTVSDGYVPIGFGDAFLPFLTPYRPIWIGLGALTFDLLLVVLVTSALRHRIGYSSWRFVHWLAYLCWPIAMFHALGSGSDSSLPLVLLIDAGCAAAVLTAVAWRLITGRGFTLGRRTVAAGATAVLTVAIGVFATLGPLRPGWSHRAGTSAALLAQLARKTATSYASTPGATAGQSGASSTGGTPSVPFTYNVTGTQAATGPNAQGDAQVVLTLQLQDASSTPLVVTLNGAAVPGGGITLSSGTVQLGSLHGAVTGLNGGTVQASLSAPTPEALTVQLSIAQGSDQVSGTVTGTADTGGG